ncbi:unnamed protein product, partial [Brassica oleracea]
MKIWFYGSDGHDTGYREVQYARQSHKRIGVIRKDTTTDNQQIVGLSYPKCSCRNCVTTYKV